MKHRIYISNVLLTLSSWLKFAGKMVRTKEKGIVCDALTLPGWFILDNCLTRVVTDSDKGLLTNGFEWYIYDMPDEWVEQMDKLKRQAK